MYRDSEGRQNNHPQGREGERVGRGNNQKRFDDRKDGRFGDRRNDNYKKDDFRKNRSEEGRGFHKDRANGDFRKNGRDFRKDRPGGGFRKENERGGFRKENRVTARDVALDALRDVVRNEAYASQALDRRLENVKLSDEDRRLAASIFYFAVENRLRIEWTLGKLMETKPEPVVADIMHIAAAQILFMDKIPDHAAVDEAVKQVRNAGREGLVKLVNGVLRSLVRARDAEEIVLPSREESPEEYLSISASISQAAVHRLVEAYGFELAEEIVSYAQKNRETTVRANRMQMSDAAFEDYLTNAGYAWTKGTVSGAYNLTGAGSIAASEGYRKGLFSIQGESSMLAAQAVGAKPGMQILDACAAPGGKTCLMSECMGGSGRVYAWDVHPHRVELIRAAAKRLHLENVRAQVHDARKTLESMELAMDAVLVDAPCSGLGVMWDKPDIKYRLNDQEFDALMPLQKDILEACAKCVRVGGRLVYSTCTILPGENEEQVRAFLAKHPEFELDTDVRWLPEALRDKAQEGMLTLLPARDGLEGFFIARMCRRSI